ncbi:MAG: EamA family transporter [Burkholderiales bacterium]
MTLRAYAYALAAVALWGTLALLSVELASVPPFLLLGAALLIGAIPGLPFIRRWRVPFRTFALGVFGLFGFHLLLFLALRVAPPVEANLVNYLWPLLIVLLSPLLLPGSLLAIAHIGAGIVGCAGAAIIIAGNIDAGAARNLLGFAFALGSAFVWAVYSLLTKRVAPFSSAAVGGFCVASSALALACHALFEPAYAFQMREMWLLAAIGIGPMGSAFFLWDRAIKEGDPRIIGTLAYLTPLLSTGLLLLAGHGAWSGQFGIAAVMIVGAAVWAGRITPKR